MPKTSRGNAAANQPSTFAPADCDCFVCTALRSHTTTPWTETLTYRPDELYANLVGFRRKDSIHNTFDDRLMVFVRPMATDAAKGRTLAALREAVSADLLADLAGCATKAGAHARVCSCKSLAGGPPGVWVVLWLVITTDPGETIDKAYVKLLKQIEELRRGPTPLAVDASGDTPEEAGRRKKLADAELKKKRYDDDPSHGRVVFREGATAHGGIGRGISDGRGMMALGQVRDRFHVGLHLRSQIVSGGNGMQAALHCIVGGGWRMWSGRAVLDAVPDPKHPQRAQHQRHIHLAGAGVVRHAVHGAMQTAPWTQPRPLSWDAAAERWFVGGGAAQVPVADDDVLFVADPGVGGTNHHRAHYVHVAAGALAEGLGPGTDSDGVGRGLATFATPSATVNNWSEGCQVNPGFHAFNLFLRLVTLTVRWRCAASASRPDGCEVVTPGSDDAALSPTEALLMFGSKDIDAQLRAYLSALSEERGDLVKVRDQAVTVERAARAKVDVERARSKPVVRAIAAATAAADAAAAKTARAVGELDDHVARFPWLDEHDRLSADLRNRKAELATATARKKGDPDRAGAIEEATRRRDEAQAALEAFDGAACRRVDLRRAAVKRFRSYVPVLQKQFMRGCDGAWSCRQKLDYTLLEADDDDVAALDHLFKHDARMRPFNPETDLVLGS